MPPTPFFCPLALLLPLLVVGAVVVITLPYCLQVVWLLIVQFVRTWTWFGLVLYPVAFPPSPYLCMLYYPITLAFLYPAPTVYLATLELRTCHTWPASQPAPFPLLHLLLPWFALYAPNTPTPALPPLYTA